MMLLCHEQGMEVHDGHKTIFFGTVLEVKSVGNNITR